jgi:hypothetical protein
MMHQINYLKIFSHLVVGELAVNIQEIPRATYDIDLLLDMSKKNLGKFISLMKKLGFKPKAPVKIEDLLSEEKREKWIKEKNMKAFSLYHPKFILSDIDVIINTTLNYEKTIKNVVYKKVNNISLPVISIKDLTKMKSNSLRKQDISDVEMLEKLI